MAGRCLTPYPTDGQHWCSRSFGHSGAHVNTTIDVTWLDDTPAAVVDVPAGSPAYRLINDLTAEREALQGQLDLDSKRVYNAQVRAEKLSDTIDRVRTVLLDFGQLDKSNQTTALEALEKIDEIIDGEEDEDAPA